MANPNKQFYKPIWDKLKETGHCKVAVPIPLQRRVIKGVITAKYKDRGWKFLHNTEIKYSISGTQVYFTLINYDSGIPFITLEEL